MAVHRAIRRGALERGPCERCGATEDVHGHHTDYSRPLNVTWLCRKCHFLDHRLGEIFERLQRDLS